jgi:hypothetical protein
MKVNGVSGGGVVGDGAAVCGVAGVSAVKTAGTVGAPADAAGVQAVRSNERINRKKKVLRIDEQYSLKKKNGSLGIAVVKPNMVV